MPARALRFSSLALLAALGLSAGAAAQPDDDGLNVLVVTAHPDDETLMSGAIYKLAQSLGANVDLALVTDGSGGYDWAMIAEPLYGVEIDTEPAARDNLPAIRKRELMGAGRILGVRNFFFLDEYDHGYTTDVDTVLQHVWDAGDVRDRLGEIMARRPYDYVLGLLPTPETHGHHKGATILALEVAAALPVAERPVVLGADFFNAADLSATGGPPYTFTGLDGYPVTRVAPDAPILRFDRMQPMESDNVVNYKLIANWVLAEYKSQGDLASYFNRGDYEFYWFFAANDPARLDDTHALFERLDENAWRPASND